jgi:peptidoglycan/LPS O-acetylase OafA/YrhL
VTSVEVPTETRHAQATGHAVHHVRELEGLRALAAIAVVVTHAGFLAGTTGRNVLPGFVARMDVGVALFFVLSGFLLYRPYARSNAGLGSWPSLRVFALRRTARLVPAWLCVLVATPLLWAGAREAPLSSWLANLAQLQGVKQSWILPGLAQLWSLSTEVMFYIALPGLAWLVARLVRGRRPRAELVALAGVMVLAQAFRALDGWGVLPAGFTWLQTLPATLDWFGFGMLLACLTARPGRFASVTSTIRHSPVALWVLAACLMWVLTTRLAGPYDLAQATVGEQTFKHLGYGLFAFLVIAPSAVGGGNPLSGVLGGRVMRYLGQISYAIFLWHLPIMFALRHARGLALFSGHFWFTLLGTLLVTIPVAAASWHFVEEPAQRFVRERTS